MFLKINKCFHRGDDSFTAEQLTCEQSVCAVSRWMCFIIEHDCGSKPNNPAHRNIASLMFRNSDDQGQPL